MIGTGMRRARERHPLQVAHGLDVRVVEHLLGANASGAAGSLAASSSASDLGLGLVGAPLLHEVVEDVAVLPAQVVVGEAGVVEQVLAADQPAPALEHRLAGDLQQHPAAVATR